jgi:hypothetical protein
MTIAVSAKVGEGLVMAADSTSSFFSQNTLAQSYHNARKLLQLKDYPIGILTFGLASVAGRNLESLVAEFEQTLPDCRAGEPYTVREITDGLHAFLLERYERVFPPPAALPLAFPAGEGQDGPPGPAEQPGGAPAPAPPPDERPQLGVVIGGFSRDEFYPDEFQMFLPIQEPNEIWPDPGENQRQYGVRWWGQTAPIERLYLGCDLRIIDWFVENGISQADAFQHFAQLRDRLMWPIIYEGMPIQDAVDLAVYLVNVTIGHSRFAVGPPVCGGQIDVATITSRGFNWVRKKELAVKADSVFF